MSTKATTLANRRSIGSAMAQFSKEYMYIIGLILLSVIFSVISLVKYDGQQLFFTWKNWKTILLR